MSGDLSCDICEKTVESVLKHENRSVCEDCEPYVFQDDITYRKATSRRGEVWLRTEKAFIGVPLLSQLCPKNVWYNGKGYFRCQNRTAAEWAIRTLRGKEINVKRCAPPMVAQMSQGERTMISMCFHKTW